jgi:mono/diheme cytochrome c family protein
VNLRIVPRMILGSAMALAVGCSRPPEPAYESSAQVAKLDAKFQAEIRAVLTRRCGIPAEPRLMGSPKLDPAYLQRGAEVYMKNCRHCHGVTGDGNGPAAKYMAPRPRDYRPGVFKFTSTTYGSKPLREDLIRTVRRGIAGTSMPKFHLLPQRDLEAVVDYVLVLTHRGELETQLAEAVEFDGKVDPEEVPKMAQAVLAKWRAAPSQVVTPLTPMPEFTGANVKAGKVAFLSKACSKCHGDDGRGQTKENIGVDSWGHPTKAADLTSGMLRGGTEPLDIYRHIDSGINGTPMPSFRSNLQQEPETVWNLVAFVLYLSNERRHGTIPEAGILKPLPGVERRAEASEKAATGPPPQPVEPSGAEPARSE